MRNYHKIPIIVFSLTLLFAGTSVSAQTERTFKPGDIKPRIEGEKRIGTSSKEIARPRAEKLGIHIRMTIEKLENAISRIEDNALRVETRIAKLEEKGMVLTDAKRLLGEARTKIAEAKAEVNSLGSLNVDSFESSTPKETVLKVRQSLAKAGEKVKEAHRALVQAIEAINAKVKSEVKADVKDKKVEKKAKPNTQ